MAEPTSTPQNEPPTRAGSSDAPSPMSALSLQTYLQIIRRQRRLLVVVAMLTTFFGMLPALLADPVYASTARVQVSSLDREGVFTIESGLSNLTTDRIIDLLTEIEILGSPRMRAAVHERLGDSAPDYTGPRVRQVGFSEIAEIIVAAGDPAVAADVANAYADVFVEDRRERSTQTLLEKAAELREQSSDATRQIEAIGEQVIDETLPPNEAGILQARQAALIAQVHDFDRRADQLAVEAALRGRGTQLIAPAELEMSPISSSPYRGGILGLTLGVLLGLAIAVVVDTVQDRIGGREDLTAVLGGSPVLAAVPHADFRGPDAGEQFAVQEAFRYLRTGVRIFGLNAELRSVLVTSAVGGEGKTTTAVNLARAMAAAGDRVVLVDGDLRRPTIHEHFELPNEGGLSTLILGDSSLDEVTQFVQENLAVLTAGPLVQNPTELLGSEAFAVIIGALIEQADFVILDSPPVLPVADALIAGQLVDGVLAVSRIGQVRRRSVRDLLHRLHEAAVPIVGFVANDTVEPSPYGYYDSYEQAAFEPRRARSRLGWRPGRARRRRTAGSPTGAARHQREADDDHPGDRSEPAVSGPAG